MSSSPEFRFLQAIGKEAERRCAVVTEQLQKGVPQDFAHYQKAVGYFLAWSEALAFAQEENDKMMRS